ncbi:MAG: CDP-alcohol phosphatidyltransferase family protein [Chromatiaceae bacterium]|nr:CDP-alcohol phosphatidyltransferase family protein [Chromatiaceae bacterium]
MIGFLHMAAPPTTRRPLVTRDASWAQRLAGVLTQRRVPPNGISLASLGFALAGGAAFLAATGASAGWRSALFAIAAACIQLRLLCNLLDGMVAVEGGLGSPAGEVYNDLPDRIADPLLIVPAGYATGLALGPELGWTAGLLAVLTAYVRQLGAATGLPQSFAGPMAKPQRMAVMTATAVGAAFAVPFGWDGVVLACGLVLVGLGALLTSVRRTRTILRSLESR